MLTSVIFFLIRMHEDGEGIRLGGHSLLNTADEAILHVIVDDPNY